MGLSCWDKHICYRNFGVEESPNLKGAVPASVWERVWESDVAAISSFCQQPELADIVFLLDDDKPSHTSDTTASPRHISIPGHSIVLANACTNLYAGQGGDYRSMREVKLPGVKPEVLAVFLECCYGQPVSNIHFSQWESLYDLASRLGSKEALHEKLRAYEKSSQCEESDRESERGGNMSPSLAEFFNRSILSDVELHVGEDLIPAHRLALCSGSPVFNKMLNCGLRESVDKCVDLQDTTKSAVLAMLEYIYTGEIKSLHMKVLFSIHLVTARRHFRTHARAKVCHPLSS